MSWNPVPTPYVATPATHWDGIDGNWSTFRISVGREAGSEAGQDFRVLVSTHGEWVGVPTSEGCIPQFGVDCPASRGVETFHGQQSRGFQANQSQSWAPINSFTLDFESNLGLDDHGGTFGYDTVRLGFNNDQNQLQVNNTLVVEFAEPAYWMGVLGLGDENTTLTDSQPIYSLIRTLNETGALPSQSYGYTAGAYHRYSGVPGSLVIGGYDISRFEPPTYSFYFSSDTDRYLSVGLQSVHTNFSLAGGAGHFDLLPDSHMSVIDSTVSQLWLPEDACDRFQEAFGLTYDAKRNYYLINDTMHDSLQANNPSLTFTLSHTSYPGPQDTIQITLPYAAFDHFIHWPAYVNDTRYFPIRRAKNDTQYTIGRVFLQEAYLTVNYENGSFSVAQATFSDTMPDPDIRTIHSATWVDSDATSSMLNGRAIAGIAIGATVSVLLMLSIIYFYWWRPRRQAMMHKMAPELQPNWQKAELPTEVENQVKRPELDASNGVYELNGVCGSCELQAPVGCRDVQGVVYEMDASHEAMSAIREDDRSGEEEVVEGRTSEQREMSGQRSSPGVEGQSS